MVTALVRQSWIAKTPLSDNIEFEFGYMRMRGAGGKTAYGVSQRWVSSQFFDDVVQMQSSPRIALIPADVILPGRLKSRTVD